MAADLGEKFGVRVWTDSDAGRSVANRRGLGKLRHLEVKFLWVQDVVREGRLQVKRVNGTENIADHLTKPIGQFELNQAIVRAGGMIESRSRRTAHAR